MSNTNNLLKISYWAKENLWKARMFIIMGLIALTNCAIFWGEMLHEEGFYLSNNILYTSAIIFVGFAITYPISNTNHKKYFFLQRKVADFILMLSTTLMIMVQSNHLASNKPYASSQHMEGTAYAWVPKKIENSKTEQLPGLNKEEKRNFKKAIISELKTNKSYSNGEKIALTLLSVLGAAALLILLAMAVCNLSCSGAEGAAVLVAVAGVGAVIFLFILIMRRIHGQNKTSTKGGGSTETE